MKEFVRDEVVISLYERKLITWPQVFQLVRSNQDETNFWRSLLDTEYVDSHTVYLEAATIGGFEVSDLSEAEPSDDIIRPIIDLLDKQTVAELLQEKMLPVEIQSKGSFEEYSIVIVTNDPTAVDAEVLSTLIGKPIVLQYANKQVIDLRIRRLGILAQDETSKEEFYKEQLAAALSFEEGDTSVIELSGSESDNLVQSDPGSIKAQDPSTGRSFWFNFR